MWKLHCVCVFVSEVSVKIWETGQTLKKAIFSIFSPTLYKNCKIYVQLSSFIVIKKFIEFTNGFLQFQVVQTELA